MGFMQPAAEYHPQLWRVDFPDGESAGPLAPDEVDDAEARGRNADDNGAEPERVPLGPGWRARLSAPGYLDCTDWSGPFPTERAALEELARTHDLCPHCMEQCGNGGDDYCPEGAADALRAAAAATHGEYLRGRGKRSDDIPGFVATLLEGDGAETARATVGRAMRLGIDDARRSILADALQLLRALVMSIDGPQPPHGAAWSTPSGMVSHQAPADAARVARLRFPRIGA